MLVDGLDEAQLGPSNDLRVEFTMTSGYRRRFDTYVA